MPKKEAGAAITLRPFSMPDTAALADIHMTARKSMQLFEEPYSLSEHASYIAGLSVGTEILIAQKNKTPVGFLAYARRSCDKIGLISHLFVRPENQRQGIGRILLEHALAHYSQPVTLWCFEANKRARSLYESCGFSIVERTDGSANAEGLPSLCYKHN